MSRISLDRRGMKDNYVFWHAADPGGRASYYHDRIEGKVVEIKMGHIHEFVVDPGSVQAQRLAEVGMRMG